MKPQAGQSCELPYRAVQAGPVAFCSNDTLSYSPACLLDTRPLFTKHPKCGSVLPLPLLPRYAEAHSPGCPICLLT